jgi:hypothetical protein
MIVGLIESGIMLGRYKLKELAQRVSLNVMVERFSIGQESEDHTQTTIGMANFEEGLGYL